MSPKAEKLAVIGAGTMGRGIATAAVLEGYSVALADLDAEALAQAADDVHRRAVRVEADPKGSVQAAPAIRDAVEGADVVLEAVPERPSVKAQVLTEVMAAAGPEALIGSNTSTMSIAGLDEACGERRRLIGLHFFNPAEKMKLLEIVVAEYTTSELLARAQEFGASLGKTSIVVRDVPGFVTSRLGLILGNEAMRLLQDGIASATAIDTAMRLGYNHPMGPLELADLVGLDARLNNLRALHEASGDERLRPLDVLIEAVTEGRLGRKTGEGFYHYDDHGRRLTESGVDN